MSARAHFKIAGIPVRVEPAFLVIAVLFGFRFLDESLMSLLLWVACTFVSILVHELGHGFALKAFGQPSAIVLHGFGGVTISQRRSQLSRARSVLVSLAGSLTALALLWWPARTALHTDWAHDQFVAWFFSRGKDFSWWRVLDFLAFQNLWWSVANLLPIRPLDGGNVTTELFGLNTARKASIAVAVAGGVWAITQDQTYAALFAFFLGYNNFRELKEEQAGHDVDAFHVDSPEAGSGKRSRGRGHRRGHLHAVPAGLGAPAGAPTLTPADPARQEQLAWNALRAGDGPTARLLADRLGPGANAYLRASVALTTGAADAFQLFEAAYVAEPAGPPNLVATELLARSGAAKAVATRLLARPDGKGRDGAATLQTHLHYGDRFREAAEVGEAVFEGSPASPAQTAFEVACSWAKAGEADRALDWLDRAAGAGFRAASIVDGEPDLASVRDDPRWPVLRARLS
jgi:Zn-dependent protease